MRVKKNLIFFIFLCFNFLILSCRTQTESILPPIVYEIEEVEEPEKISYLKLLDILGQENIWNIVSGNKEIGKHKHVVFHRENLSFRLYTSLDSPAKDRDMGYYFIYFFQGKYRLLLTFMNGKTRQFTIENFEQSEIYLSQENRNSADRHYFFIHLQDELYPFEAKMEFISSCESTEKDNLSVFCLFKKNISWETRDSNSWFNLLSFDWKTRRYRFEKEDENIIEEGNFFWLFSGNIRWLLLISDQDTYQKISVTEISPTSLILESSSKEKKKIFFSPFLKE